MEVRINIEKRHFFILIGVILLLIGVIAVVAYNPSGTGGVPSEMGHSVDEIEWSQVIPGLSVGEVGSATTIDSGGIIMGNMLDMNSKVLTNLVDPPINSRDATTKNYVDAIGNAKVSKSGDTMSGVLNMDNNQISNLPYPANNGNAMSLGYFKARLKGVNNTVIGCGINYCEYQIGFSGLPFSGIPVVTCSVGNGQTPSFGWVECGIVNITKDYVKVSLSSSLSTGQGGSITGSKDIYIIAFVP